MNIRVFFQFSVSKLFKCQPLSYYMAKEKRFVKCKMCINGIIDDVSVPINSLDEVKHLIIK